MNYFLEVNFCWAAFYGVYTLWLRRETFFGFNRGYLLGGLILGLVLPLPDYGAWVTPPTAPVVVTYLIPVVTVGAGNELIDQTIVSWSITDLVYRTGVALFAAWLLVQIGRLVVLFFKSKKEKAGTYWLIQTGKNHSPFSFFHLMFIRAKADYSEEELEQILAHERAHGLYLHSIDLLLIEGVRLAFWCSPLPYLFHRELRLQHEYQADAAVLKTGRRRQYGHLLIRQTLLGGHPAIAHPFIASFLKNRIAMMTKTRSSRKALWKYALALPLLVVLTLLLTLREVRAQSASQAQEEVFKVVEEMPRFPGCEDLTAPHERQECSNKKMMEYVASNLKYPKQAADATVEGTVVVKFVVQKDGTLGDIDIVKGIGGGCDEEVLRLMHDMNTKGILWIPGRAKGKTVNVEYNLPIRFKSDMDAGVSLKREAVRGGISNLAELDQIPLFAGCTKADPAECSNSKLIAYLMDKMRYPKSAREAGVEGMVVASFTINEKGKVADPKIVKSLNDACDEEVLRLLEEMPDWTPGYKGSKPMATTMTLPIQFALPKDEATPKSLKPLQLKNFDVAPNPTSGDVRIRFEGPVQSTFIKIVDVSGREVFALEIPDFGGQFDQRVDLSKAARGVAVIQIMQNSAVYAEKIMLK